MGKFKQIDQLCEENDREGLIEFLAELGVKKPHKQADIYLTERRNTMGCRGTIEIWEYASAPKSEERPVVLYTHWGADDMMYNISETLKRKKRWSDPAYLSRMIFCEMVKDDTKGSTGYGILTDNVGDAQEEIVVDCSRHEIIRKRIGHDNQIFTFNELIEE